MNVLISTYFIGILASLYVTYRFGLSRKMVTKDYYLLINFLFVLLWPIGIILHNTTVKKHGGSWKRHLAKQEEILNGIRSRLDNLPETQILLSVELDAIDREFQFYDKVEKEYDRKNA